MNKTVSVLIDRPLGYRAVVETALCELSNNFTVQYHDAAEKRPRTDYTMTANGIMEYGAVPIAPSIAFESFTNYNALKSVMEQADRRLDSN